MAWCTTLVAVSGGFNARITAAESTQAQLDACTTPILINSTEYHDMRAESAIWGISAAQGSQIAGSILVVWAIGYVYRLLARAISETSETSEKETS